MYKDFITTKKVSFAFWFNQTNKIAGKSQIN